MSNKNNKYTGVFGKARLVFEFVAEVVVTAARYFSGKIKEANILEKIKSSLKSLFKRIAESFKKPKKSIEPRITQKSQFFKLPKRETVEKKQSKSFNKTPVIVTLAAVCVILFAGFCTASIYFSGHFLSGTKINGLDVSGMTTDEAAKLIASSIENYELTLIEKNAISEKLKGIDVGLNVSVSDDFDDILKLKSGYFWLKALFGEKNIDASKFVSYSFDEALFDKTLSGLVCISPAVVSKPVNAELYYYDGSFRIRPEVTGNSIDSSVLKERIKKAITEHEAFINLESECLYPMPEVLSDNEELLAKKNAFEPIESVNISFGFGDSTENIDPQKISEWYVCKKTSEGYDISLNQEAVANYVETLAKLYDTVELAKPFVTHDGSVIYIGNSYYGWQLDQEYAAETIIKCVNERSSLSLDLTDHSEESSKWWTKTAAAYDKYNYYGSTYAEVSIDAQYMWMYENGEVALESDVVTGRPDSEHDTPIGIYSIIYKEQNATLRGEDYETEVAYWMVFTFDIGFHDADWQYAFGDDMYYENGSHGCVNLPMEVAEELYDLVYPGMPVFVY